MTEKKIKKLKDDIYLKPYEKKLILRKEYVDHFENKLTQNKLNLEEFSNAHEYFGLHKHDDHWIFREWAPNATAIYLIGDFSNWQLIDDFALSYGDQNGVWEIEIPIDKINHNDLYKLQVFGLEVMGSVSLLMLEELFKTLILIFFLLKYGTLIHIDGKIITYARKRNIH